VARCEGLLGLLRDVSEVSVVGVSGMSNGLGERAFVTCHLRLK
jgi:hypothetical protein